MKPDLPHVWRTRGIKARLLLFWMGTLALVLVLFSVATYGIARHRRNAQLRAELRDVLEDVALSIKVRANDAQPHKPAEPADVEAAASDSFWMIAALDPRSSQLTPLQASPRWRHLAPFHERLSRPFAVVAAGDDDYLLMQSSLHELLSGSNSGSPLPELILTAACSLEKTQQHLRNLALTLGGTSIAIWLAAWGLGVWLVNRALAPLTTLARQAERIGQNDLHERLTLGHGAPTDEIALLAQAFNGCLERLETSFEQQRRFTSEASHELRTPLTIIQGEAELALRRPRDAGEYVAALERVNAQSARLLDLIERLLFLARPTGQENLVQQRPIVAESLLDDLRTHWQTHPRFKDMRFVIDAGAAQRTIIGQPALLAVVLDNLVDNAAKYSPPGTPVTIALTAADGTPPAAQTQPGLAITISDEGPGIEALVLPHLFTPFYRGESSAVKARNGSGLGLSIAQRIATLHGGEVRIESPVRNAEERMAGTRATVWLPLSEQGRA